MLQALFLLKQHVLPRVQDCEDMDRFADACPIVSEPCGVFSDNLRGVIRNVAKQFNKNNLVAIKSASTVISPAFAWFDYACYAYKYLPQCPPQSLLVATPEIEWRRVHHHGWDVHKYVVPANDKDIDFIKPIFKAMGDAIFAKVDDSFAMCVSVRCFRALPWTFSASITMCLELKFSAGTNTLRPHMMAKSVDRGPLFKSGK